MAKEIIDIHGNKRTVECIGCAIQTGIMDRVGEGITTEYFDAHQDVEIPIPGFVILASRRHIMSVDEFTESERKDFIDTLCRARKALREALAIQTVYLIQEEDTSDHFHLWIFPRYEWMTEKFGRKIQSVRPIMEYAQENMKTPENLQKVQEVSEKFQKAFV